MKLDESKNPSLNGLNIVVTGTLETFSRNEIISLIKSLGGKASISVSNQTSFLLAGQNPGSKLQQALELNIPTLNELEFLEMVNKQKGRSLTKCLGNSILLIKKNYSNG